MTYLLDTDWVASWLNGQADAIKLIKNISKDGLAISLITFGEIYEGIYYGRNPKVAEQAFKNFLSGVILLPLNKSVMKQFARIRGDLRKQGMIISDNDILIAATAIFHGLELVSRNIGHFNRIPQLKIYIDK